MCVDERGRQVEVHEASILGALIGQVKSFLPKGASLESVHVEVGDLEHLDEEVMRFLWGAMTVASGLEGARLEVTRVPVKIRCAGCETEYEPANVADLTCPACRATRPEVIQGSGVVLRSLEVEDGTR